VFEVPVGLTIFTRHINITFIDISLFVIKGDSSWV
jgi:hypothetical protein